MAKVFRLIFLVTRFATKSFLRHDGVEHSGYLAFLCILSIFPFMVFVVSATGFFGQMEVGSKFIDIILQNIPENMVDFLNVRINEITSGPPQNLLTIAVIGMIWTSSSFLEGLKTIFNRVYEVKTPPTYIIRRLTSMLEFLVITIGLMLLIFSLIIIPIIIKKIAVILNIEHFRIIEYFISHFGLLRHVILILILVIFTSCIYMILPNVKQKFLSVLPGSLLAVVAWIISTKLFVLYLENFNQFNIVYGSLNNIIASIIFFYIISMILVFGAEFNYSLGVILNRKFIIKNESK